MPYNWNAESERAMLLIICAELKPNAATWQTVANRLGGGLNANAVRCAYVLKFVTSSHRAHHCFTECAHADSFLYSQKFYKLKNEARKVQTITTPKSKSATKVATKTGSATMRRREDLAAQANADTPTKTSKKQLTGAERLALATDDDNEETKPFLESTKEDGVYGRRNSQIFSNLVELDTDAEMEDTDRNAEEI
jgi:hypothetical protein